MSLKRSMAVGESMPNELSELLNGPGGVAFEQALDVLVHQREQRVFRALGHVARELHDAVRRLGGELAQEGVPGAVADARQQLEDVLEMSAKAAHRSIDFAEQMRPRADALRREATMVLASETSTTVAIRLANLADDFATDCKAGLADMVLAQSWQDLSGQRIRKVAGFIGNVEASMLELVRLTGALAGAETPADVVKITSQEDADRLLSEFGF